MNGRDLRDPKTVLVHCGAALLTREHPMEQDEQVGTPNRSVTQLRASFKSKLANARAAHASTRGFCSSAGG